MKRIFFLTLLLAVAGVNSQAKDYNYTTVADDPMGVRIYTLDNGLKVYLSVNTDQPRITAHIAVNTGSKNDPTEYTGLAHYLEHLMFKGSHQAGTTDYDKEKPYIDQITALYEEYGTLTDSLQRRAKYHEIDSISQIAAQYNIPNEYDKMMAMIGSIGTNAYTFFDITCYTEDIPSNEVDRWARVQADRFQNLVLRGFHTELEAVYEEKNISLSSDTEKSFDAALAKLFPSHSYGTQTTLGTQEHLKNPSLVAIENYYRRYYVPNNIAIVMAGDMDPTETIEVIDRYFGSWAPGQDAQPREFDPQPTFATPQDTIVVGQEQEMLIMGWRFEGAASLQADTLEVLSNVLFNQRAGLLDLDVNQKMLLQNCGAFVLDLKDYCSLFVQGVPNQGQSLSDVRDILLGEVDKIKRGEWDESLLTAINNNEKLNFLQHVDENKFRVSEMVDAYINGEDWAQYVGHIDRQRHITKADIVAFANRYLGDGYVCVEKRKGEDTSIKKIDKPEITPIPSNRELVSEFIEALSAIDVEPIHPEFVDFQKELSFFSTEKGLPVVYKQNTENELFTLQFRYDFGQQADNRYDTALDYVDLLGTADLSNEDIKKRFYELACDYRLRAEDRNLVITLSGLSENMEEALSLLDHLMQGAVADADVYRQFAQQTIETREDEKLEQRPCAYHLFNYGLNGERNIMTNWMTSAELTSADPTMLTGLVKGLSDISHSVLYYGPLSKDELSSVVSERHTTGSTLSAPLENKPYEWVKTTANDVLLAPYEAANIYMQMINQEGIPFDVEKVPVVTLFNEYFGGGMNGVVFQELRETKGLAYSAGATYTNPRRKTDPCYMQLNIITQNDKMTDCIEAFSDITTNMPQNDGALDIARENLLKNIASRRVRKYDVISTYLRYQHLGIDYDLNKTIYEALPSITMGDLVDFAKEYVVGKPLRYMILGNESELDMSTLEKIGPIRRLTIDDIYVK